MAGTKAPAKIHMDDPGSRSLGLHGRTISANIHSSMNMGEPESKLASEASPKTLRNDEEKDGEHLLYQKILLEGPWRLHPITQKCDSHPDELPAS